ncbi:heat shock protein [Angomonas deanei]|nr:heat shock protein [Angomonas deanei]|eukprot:EPY26037.1 heat shock protein [Angomonas deanei]
MSNDEAIDEAKVRHHFQVLSKHFHPDLPDAPENAAEAFRNIREAYVQVLEQVKRHGPYAAGEAPHFVFMDQAQRSAKVAAMGEGVIFFVLLLLVYAFLVARHNRKRVRASLLAYLLAIFVVVQIFPRVLSAVVLFAWMSDIRVTSKELEEQAALTILVEKSGENMIVKLAGIAEEDQPDVKVSVKVTRTEKAKGGDDNKAAAAEEESTEVLEMDQGVTKFHLPSRLVNKSGPEIRYNIRVENTRKHFTLCDKVLATDF